MADAIEISDVAKSESTLLVLFIPSVDRQGVAFDPSGWERAALEFLGSSFGGATAFPKGKGVWRDDEQGGKLIFDDTVVVHSYTNRETIRRFLPQFRDFLVRMGKETNQGAVGFVVDGTYMELRFPLPLEESTNG